MRLIGDRMYLHRLKGRRLESERDWYIQMVMDLRRVVDVLVARKDVDPDRIGYGATHSEQPGARR
jgi:hypothetical protein